MITIKEIDIMAQNGTLCWECDSAPRFEDSTVCETCYYAQQQCHTPSVVQDYK